MRKQARIVPVSLHASLAGLPRVQQRSWGAIAARPGHGAVLVLAPPRAPVAVSAREAALGSYPVLDGRESPFTAGVLLAWAAALATGIAAQAAAGGGFGPSVMTGFTAGLLAAVAAAVTGRLAARCRVIPLPHGACETACAIEHAIAAARHRTGIPDYDQDVTECVRAVLWEASRGDSGLPGAGLPLAVLLHAVLDRNRALLGPHASPAWYPALSEDPARHPPAPERALEETAVLAAALREESRLIRSRSGLAG
jgi:hypothetical protein